MKVLFWTDSFPNYSETFIRNQIINLIDNNVKVIVYTDKKGLNNLESINHLSNYNLFNIVVDENDILPKNKLYRVFKAFFILIKGLFNFKLKYYLRTLNYIK